MLARGEADWGYLVAILILSLVSWIANLIKRRMDKSRPPSADSGRHSEEAEDEGYEEAEVLSDESPVWPGEVEAPVIITQQTPRQRPQEPPPPPAARPSQPPLAAPVRSYRPPPPPAPQTAWSTRESMSSGGLQQSPLPHVVMTGTPTARLTVREAGTRLPVQRVEDLRRPFAGPGDASQTSRAAPQPGSVEPPSTSSPRTALMRRFHGNQTAALREAILIAEVLRPPLALRSDPPGSDTAGV